MEVISRTDEKVKVTDGEIKITEKYMANGEVRKRVKYPNGTSISVTKAANWKREDGLPWQDAHLHRGLTEVYIVMEGTAIFVFQESPYGSVRVKYIDSKQTIIFHDFIPHQVLLMPNTVIQTTLFGVPIGNPDRNNEDWWEFDFEEEIKKILIPDICN